MQYDKSSKDAIDGDLIRRWTKFLQLVEIAAYLHVLRKYMQAFISHKGPRNLTAGMSLAEARAVLSFEYNIALSSRQSLRYQIADNSNRTRLRRQRQWAGQEIAIENAAAYARSR